MKESTRRVFATIMSIVAGLGMGIGIIGIIKLANSAKNADTVAVSKESETEVTEAEYNSAITQIREAGKGFYRESTYDTGKNCKITIKDFDDKSVYLEVKFYGDCYENGKIPYVATLPDTAPVDACGDPYAEECFSIETQGTYKVYLRRPQNSKAAKDFMIGMYSDLDDQEPFIINVYSK